MREYKLVDLYNDDVVYHGNNLEAAKIAFWEYEYETEGDWIPLFAYRDNENERYHVVDDAWNFLNI